MKISYRENAIKPARAKDIAMSKMNHRMVLGIFRESLGVLPAHPFPTSRIPGLNKDECSSVQEENK